MGTTLKHTYTNAQTHTHTDRKQRGEDRGIRAYCPDRGVLLFKGRDWGEEGREGEERRGGRGDWKMRGGERAEDSFG